MGNSLSGGFSPSSSTSKHFICEIRSEKMTFSRVLSNWIDCNNLIIETFKTVKKEVISDQDIQVISSDLSVYGWVERTYESCGIIRGIIRPAQELKIKIQYDDLSTMMRQTHKGEIDVDSDIETVVNFTTGMLFGMNIEYNIHEDVINRLRDTYEFSDIIGDKTQSTLAYLRISLKYN